MNQELPPSKIAKRFRGFLPIVVDVETGGFNADTDALLEIAIVLLTMDEQGLLQRERTHSWHVLPFPGAHLDPLCLEVTGIDPYHPFRFAVEEQPALQQIFQIIENALKNSQCERAVLVGHNVNFDLNFLLAAAKRCNFQKIPFHQFTVLDTASLAALAFGETVLARAVAAAGIEFDRNYAHSAIYDAEKTADLFCLIVNRWKEVNLLQSG